MGLSSLGWFRELLQLDLDLVVDHEVNDDAGGE